MLLKNDGILFVEVPDFSITEQYGDFCAFWEEHLNYFNITTLTSLLIESGYKVIQTVKYNFSGGSIGAYAIKSSTHSTNLINKDYSFSLTAYINKTHKYIEKLLEKVNEAHSNNEVVVIYGAGNRSVILINHILSGRVDYIIDDQPHKQNMYIPGAKYQVLPPETLKKQKYRSMSLSC